MTDSPTQNQGKAWLYLIVFLTGASVMVIELLGTRLIAPFYGARSGATHRIVVDYRLGCTVYLVDSLGYPSSIVSY
jgi:hypothetical protein